MESPQTSFPAGGLLPSLLPCCALAMQPNHSSSCLVLKGEFIHCLANLFLATGSELTIETRVCSVVNIQNVSFDALWFVGSGLVPSTDIRMRCEGRRN